jgi:hypothetical protein
MSRSKMTPREEYCYAEWRLCWVTFMLSVENKLIMLSVIMLNVIKLSVVMLSVVAPSRPIQQGKWQVRCSRAIFRKVILAWLEQCS